MRDDDVLYNDAMRLLIDSLGAFETERFLFLIKPEFPLKHSTHSKRVNLLADKM